MAKVRIVLRWVNVGLILVTLATYLSPLVSPADFWPFAMLGLLYPWLLLGNLLFVIFWAVQRQWQALLSLGCILAGWGHVRSFIGWHSAQSPGPQIETLRVMTFNCHGLRDWKNDRGYLEEESLAVLLSAGQPDVLCLQEFPFDKRTTQRYTDYLAKHAGLRYQSQHAGGLCVYSRFPFLHSRSRYFENKANGYQVVDFQWAGQRIRLFNVHLQSNSVSRLAEQVAERGNIQERQTWLNLKGMFARYRYHSRQRAEQAEELAQEMLKSQNPIITCGDFNDVPLSYAYRLLSQAQEDTFKKRGKGLAITYSGNIPALRIDYVLAGPTFQIFDHRLHRASFSDHRPVSALLGIPKQPL